MDTTIANGQSACSDLNGEDRQRVLCDGGGDSAERGGHKWVTSFHECVSKGRVSKQHGVRGGRMGGGGQLLLRNTSKNELRKGRERMRIMWALYSCASLSPSFLMLLCHSMRHARGRHGRMKNRGGLRRHFPFSRRRGDTHILSVKACAPSSPFSR